MKASDQINDGASTPAAGTTEAMQVDELLSPASSKSELSLVAKSVLGSRIDNWTRIRIKNGSETEIWNGTEVENEDRNGIRIKRVIGIGIGGETRLRLASIDTEDEGIHSMSMLAELQALTIWVSNPQETRKSRRTTSAEPLDTKTCLLSSGLKTRKCCHSEYVESKLSAWQNENADSYRKKVYELYSKINKKKTWSILPWVSYDF
ncbi:hypothetical protein EVAR_33578_1 [Eumeta japonica]|uniref:Uncharacterized protein n=1 Tax=Eumeta variegata TaxID=151549 RepID=A0A4C1VKL2_EUMVA|nr:hypothetical protein EVAR_33578_1 [Eumeta japonica]